MHVKRFNSRRFPKSAEFGKRRLLEVQEGTFTCAGMLLTCFSELQSRSFCLQFSDQISFVRWGLQEMRSVRKKKCSREILRITLASGQPALYSAFPPPRPSLRSGPTSQTLVSGWVGGGNTKMSLTFTTRWILLFYCRCWIFCQLHERRKDFTDRRNLTIFIERSLSSLRRGAPLAVSARANHGGIQYFLTSERRERGWCWGGKNIINGGFLSPCSPLFPHFFWDCTSNTFTFRHIKHELDFWMKTLSEIKATSSSFLFGLLRHPHSPSLPPLLLKVRVTEIFTLSSFYIRSYWGKGPTRLGGELGRFPLPLSFLDHHPILRWKAKWWWPPGPRRRSRSRSGSCCRARSCRQGLRWERQVRPLWLALRLCLHKNDLSFLFVRMHLKAESPEVQAHENRVSLFWPIWSRS